MSKKADITFSRGEGDKLVVTPDAFVLKKGVSEIRVRNDSGTGIQLDVRVSAVPSVHSRSTEASPKIIAEASPKIIVEASPKIIAERSSKNAVRAQR
jgi:hypothetical protein